MLSCFVVWGFFFRTKPEKVVLENIVVGRDHNWKLPFVTLAMQRSVSGRYGISRKLINPQFKHLGLLCEDFGIAKAAGGVWWCRLPAGCAAHSSHRCCSEPSCCRQRCPGAGTAPAPGRLEALLPRAYSSPWWPQAAPVSAGLPLPSTKP